MAQKIPPKIPVPQNFFAKVKNCNNIHPIHTERGPAPSATSDLAGRVVSAVPLALF